MKTAAITIAVTLFAVAGGAAAGGKSHRSPGHGVGEQLFDYARVVDVQPRYRRIELSEPVRECWEEPVYQTRNSAGGMLAGGLIGGIVGHQLGDGRGQRVATALGTLIGASIGHQAVNGHRGHGEQRVAGYRQHCNTHYRTSYEEVVDSYDVTYKYRGRIYHTEMPYDPGKRIKMRIQITPVI